MMTVQPELLTSQPNQVWSWSCLRGIFVLNAPVVLLTANVPLEPINGLVSAS